MYKIPFCKNTLGEEEINAVADVVRSGWVVQGSKTKEFEEKFAEYVGAKYAVFVDSGTAALDLAVKYFKTFLKTKHFYVPSLTFTSTAEVVVNNCLELRWLDVNKENFCVESPYLSTIQVHLMGNKANSKGVIEDSAHRIERNQCLGSENIVCFSFYATKNMTTVGGGMIATNSKHFYEWAKKARDHGISKGTEERYKKGDWKYSIDFVGWRVKADDVRAAIGLEQLKKLPEMTRKRNEIVQFYNYLFKLNRIGNHLYPILVENRDEFIKYMANNGIQTSVHFLPLHKMPAYQKYKPKQKLENTEYLGERLVSLPLYPDLTKEEVQFIAQKVEDSKMMING